MKNAAASPREDKRTGAFAFLWVMLRQICALMLKPGGWAEAEAKMVELETQAAWAILARALELDPGSGLSVDDFEMVSVWSARGRFDPDFRLKPGVVASRMSGRRKFLIQLRHARLVQMMKLRAATYRGIAAHTRRRRAFGVSAIHRRRAALRACARIAGLAAPRAPIPP